jgi:capsular polysaccharide transport system permease protein
LLDPVQESLQTSSFITGLEAKLVDLKVEEASLRRQYRDPKAPEVLVVSDQVGELKRQIAQERIKAVNPDGSNLSGLTNEIVKLQDEVNFEKEALKASLIAMDKSRRESQRQLKFVVLLSDPQAAVIQDWQWRWKLFLGVIGVTVVIGGMRSFLLGISSRK